MKAVRHFIRAIGGRLSTRLRISIGLVLLLLSMMVSLTFVGLLPDERQLVREARTNLAEALAANVTALIALTDSERIETIMGFVVTRNSDLLSASVRRADGEAIVQVGDHDAHWQRLSGEHSIDSQLMVPIWDGAQKWGQVELRFGSANWLAGLGIDVHPQIVLMLVIGISAVIVFQLYLGRTLRHLDPSKAVPPRVRAALDTMAEGLMVVDLDGYIVLANQSLGDILGKQPDDIVGDRATMYAWTDAHDERLQEDHLPWTRALREKRMLTTIRLRLAADDGAVRSFNVNCSPVLGDGNQHGGVLVSFDDVTVLEQKEVQLRESRDAAEQANRAKSAFLANMSHEIRTPMNAILGFTEVLKRGYDRGGQEWKSHLSTIHSSGKHLLELINDILDLSKVESGKLEVERIETHPHVIIREVVKVLGVKAREKNIFLSLSADGPVPQCIASDPARLRQIVTNLVGNAIKFTDQGGVSVVLRLDDTGKPPMYAIDVIDTGVGMEQSAQEKIFSPFEQADSSVTRRFGGTGLGLSISKRFTEALGGEISVRSAPGQGSTFTVTLDPGPLDGIGMLQPDELALHNQNVELETDSVWQFPATRVLVVDDGKQNRALVRLVLEEAGIEVDEAENGEIAVDMAKHNAYDVVLMDINMPVMDGFTALGLMREHGMQIPVLALTADVMEGFEDKVLAAGFTGYITKPIDFDVLIESLARHTGAVRVEKAEQAAPAAPADDGMPPPAANTLVGTPITSSLPTGDPRFRAIVEEFVDQLDERIVDVEKAWASRDFEALRMAAHYLKGAGGSVGFSEFTEPSAHLEGLAKARQEAGVAEAVVELRNLASRVVLDAPATTPDPQSAVPAKAEAVEAEKPIFSRLPTGDPRFRVIVEEFIGQLDELVPALEAARAQRNFEALRHAAHYLKGAAGSVGLSEFTEPAAHLEQLARAQQKTGLDDAVGVLCKLASRVTLEDSDSQAQAHAN